MIAIQSGDHASFDRLIALYSPVVRKHVAGLLASRHEADDVVQEVFIRAHQGLPAFQLRERSSVRAWLLTTGHNLSLNRLRRRATTVADPELLASLRAEETIEPVLPGWLNDADLLMLFERLPLIQRQVLTLRHLLDLPAGEIARILQLEPGNVRQLHARALHFLRERLIALGREPKPRPARLPMREQPRSNWTPQTTRQAALHAA